MAKFKIVWASGAVEEVEQSDVSTLEGFINCRFGANHPADILPAVEMIQLISTGEDAVGEVVDTKPAKKTKK